MSVLLTAEQAQKIEDVLWTLEQHNKLYYGETHNTVIEANKALATIRAARAQEQAEQDLDTCPGCGGVADNGHDREFPPNPYYCTKCSEQAEQEPVAWMCWIDSDEEMNPANAQLTSYEPKAYAKRKPLYAAPVQQVDLTVSDLDAIIEKHYDDEMDLKAMILDGIAAFKEKNR